MDAAQRELSDLIDAATQRLLDDARTLSEADVRAPSLLPGWSRGHVLTHLARNADGMRNLLIGARSGESRLPYSSARARAAGIEEGAGRTAAELVIDLADSAMALRTISRQLPDEAWQVPVRMLDTEPFPASLLLTRRLVEVELHHCDLGTAFGPADWSPAFAALDLPEPMRAQRQDRLDRPLPADGTERKSAPRPLASWKPGQPLPGSMLGRQ